jgi:hypothetical protein
MKHQVSIMLSMAVIALLGGACGETQRTTPDFARFRPLSVLVLPPENMTSNTEVMEKSYPFVFSKLAQRGYYVISPELALQLFEANRLNEAGRINQLPTARFREVFGVDAVLKTRVTEWSSPYYVVTSRVKVGFEMALFDTRSGKLLWRHSNMLSKPPGTSWVSFLPLGGFLEPLHHATSSPYEPVAAENAALILETLPRGVVRSRREP